MVVVGVVVYFDFLGFDVGVELKCDGIEGGFFEGEECVVCGV